MSCETCPLRGSKQVPGRGTAKLVVVGEAPGAQEERVGAPFVGAAGEVLEAALQGLSREDLYITNVLKCRPPGNKMDTPEGYEAYKCCLPKLQEELRGLEPTHILALGNTALRALTGHSGITKYRGQVLQSRWLPGAKVFASYHPAAVLYTPGRKPLLEQDILSFCRLASGRQEAVTEEITYSTSLPHCLGALEVSSAFAYDIETTGLSWRKDSVKSVAIACSHSSVPYVLTRPEEIAALVPYFLNSAMHIAHNGKFDNLFLRKLGFTPRLDFDTMLASHLWDENMPHDLQFLACTYLKVPPWKHLAEQDELLYNARDALYTLKLYEVFNALLATKQKLPTLFYEVVMPAARSFEEIECNGLPLSRKRLRRVQLALQAEVRDEEKVLHTFTTEAKPTWNLSNFLKKLVFEEFKMPVLKRTEKGAPALDKAVLQEYAKTHIFFEKLLLYRDAVKDLQFLASWDKLQDSGRLYPSYKLHGTVTGRLSAADPNVQQIPRDKKIRGIIGAPRGRKFLCADFSQIELRIAAEVFKEPRMQGAYARGEDIHKITASSLMGKPGEEITKDERSLAKAVNFGLLYGMGAKGLQAYAKASYGIELTEGEASLYRNKFFAKWSGLLQGHRNQMRIAKLLKRIATPMGRTRHLPEIDSPDFGIRAEAERQALNAPVQGMASDMTLLAIAILTSQLNPREARIVGMIHDSILLEVKDECAERTAKQVKKVMEHLPLWKFGIKWKVPIEADVTISQFWGE